MGPAEGVSKGKVWTPVGSLPAALHACIHCPNLICSSKRAPRCSRVTSPACIPSSPLCSLVETAQEFNTRSAHVLTLGRDGASFANTIDANELQQLLLRADRLSIKVGTSCCLLCTLGCRVSSMRRQTVRTLLIRPCPSLPASCGTDQLRSLPYLNSGAVVPTLDRSCTRPLPAAGAAAHPSGLPGQLPAVGGGHAGADAGMGVHLG